MNSMEVYFVAGYWLDDGHGVDDEDSFKIFLDEVKADKYVKDLEEQLNETGLNDNMHKYDYVVKLPQAVQF